MEPIRPHFSSRVHKAVTYRDSKAIWAQGVSILAAGASNLVIDSERKSDFPAFVGDYICDFIFPGKWLCMIRPTMHCSR